MNPEHPQNQVTRREAIKRTIFFSSALLAPGFLQRLVAQPSADFAKDGFHMLALGDFGTGKQGQFDVARQMAEFAQTLKAPLNCVLALGDNFYVDPTQERFQALFEDMYSKEHLNCPFYACLGNHDYWGSEKIKHGRDKAQAELDYATNNPTSRWKMPHRWYAVELPDSNAPLVKLIYIDTNYSKSALTEQERVDQLAFLDAELKKGTKAPWLWLAGHHPIFSNGDHGDNAGLIERFGPYLKNHPFSMYLSGHDHTLQHLEVEGYNTSFVVSGAGGQDLYNVKQSGRAPFSQKLFGFNHFHITSDYMDVQFIGTDGKRLHGFRRTRDGKMQVI